MSTLNLVTILIREDAWKFERKLLQNNFRIKSTVDEVDVTTILRQEFSGRSYKQLMNIGGVFYFIDIK